MAVGAIQGQSAMVGDTVALTVSSYFADPDGDRLLYDARSSDPGVATVSAAGDTVTVVAVRRGAAAITVTASDPGGLEASQPFELTVLNSGPAAAGRIPDLELPLGQEATAEVSPYFTDPDGDALAYRAESSDPAVAAADTSGSAVTVRALARGTATITVTAADPDGLEAALDFELTVPNSGPAATGPIADLELPLGDEATVDVSSRFTDPDGDALAYRAESSDPAVAAADTSGSAVTVRALARGSATITVTAADPDGLEAALDFELTVPNSGPAATGPIADLELPLGDEATVDVSSRFTDPDGDALAYRAESSDPAVAAADTSGSAVTVRALARGSATITVTAADPDGLEAALDFELTVPNSGPAATGPIADLELPLGDEATVDVSSRFTDPDGDALAYRAESSDPAVAAADTSGSAVTVRALARGSATITVTAADPDGLEAALDFELTVPNSGPAATGPIADLELPLGDEATVDVSSRFTDPDGDALAYRAESSDPAVAAADTSGSAVTVRALARGSATITVTAADPDGLEAALDFELTVPNSGPAATGPIADLELPLGDEATVDVSSRFTDPDGDALAYRAESSDPAVAAADTSGSAVTVRALARGSATITVTAADPDGLEAALDFELTVPNSGPAATGPIADLELPLGDEATVDVSSRFTDPDGDALAYRAESSDPAVAAADTSGSAVTVRALARGSATITVTAADPDGLEASQGFEVTVPNNAPVIVAPIPDRDLSQGEEIDFSVAPFFDDPDGDALRFRAASSHEDVVTADIEDDKVTVRAFAAGRATITVAGVDPAGLEVSQDFLVTVLNSPPGIVTPLPHLTLTAGARIEIVASRYFNDPDGDAVSFTATSSDEGVVTVTVAEDTVSLETVAVGSARVTVTATDEHGASRGQAFDVTVNRRITTPGFEIDLAFTSEVSAAVRSVVRGAASTWEAILANTDLRDVTFKRRLSCAGLTTVEEVDVVDDLLVLVTSDRIDGPGGTLGYAGMCSIRAGSGLPVYGRFVLDEEDIDRFLATGRLHELVVHEIAHILGFGLLWDSFGLLENPSSGSRVEVDTHFTGSGAVAAFNAAGGTSYTGGKVPVENTRSGRDAHWRKSVFLAEVMAPTISAVNPSSLSAITIRSLSDLGYAVDTGLADPYSVPSPDIAPERLGPVIEFGDDILRVPLRVVDENGRVVRVIPPR